MSDSRGWKNPSAPPSANQASLTPEQMAARLHEMEALCADVYSAAVELGLPRDLLNRLWVVAGSGTAPQAFAFDRAHAQQQIHAHAPKTSAPPAPASMPPLKRRRTVLVADDDPRMLELLIRILRKENYELITAESGPAALAAMKGRPALDLLIADVMMPDMMGPELAGKLRATYPDLPVLYQTGFSDELFEGTQDLGDRSAFVEKPFTARGLLEAARMVMFGSINPRNG
ncbi:MAG: response regulator [Acidobacteriota bacterium]|nr:response regulator [Acidobacteriota bacterium]